MYLFHSGRSATIFAWITGCRCRMSFVLSGQAWASLDIVRAARHPSGSAHRPRRKSRRRRFRWSHRGALRRHHSHAHWRSETVPIQFSFNLVQLGSGGIGAIGERSRVYLPYHFTSRGPIPGLSAAPIVMAMHHDASVGMAGRRSGNPSIRSGFAAYRIAMIVLTASSLLMVFSLLRRMVSSDRWALFGAASRRDDAVRSSRNIPPGRRSMAGWVLARRYLLLEFRPWLLDSVWGVGVLAPPGSS